MSTEIESPSNHRAGDPPLQPARALLTPLFTASLLLLVVNDHVLKGADLLPNWLTGKLSVFAGLKVAPVVLAVAIRARTTLGFLACQFAVVLFLGGKTIAIGSRNGLSR